MTMTQNPQIERLPINGRFAAPADRAALERAASALRKRNIEAHIVDSVQQARDLVLGLVPDGSEVGQGASRTLEASGVTEALETSGNYKAVRARTRSMDRTTQMRDIRKLSSAPDFFLNSVHALTEEGQMLVASMSGSQIGPLASGAGRVILVVGAQKVVPDLPTAMRRLDEYAFPMEDARAQHAYGRHSAVNKLLVVNGDFPGRTTVILVAEPIGV